MRSQGGFAHLRVHSHYTLLGGTPTLEGLAARAAAEGMGRLALTDTNVLYGVVAFARACKREGIQPITGMTVTVAAPDEKNGMKTGAGVASVPAQPQGQLVLLATGVAGYRSLCKLSSLVQASPEREILASRGLSWGDLEEHRDGLICVSGGRKGWVERHVRSGDLQAASHYAGRLSDIYGDRVFLSLELHTDDDRIIAERVGILGSLLGMSTAAVQPVYCLSDQEQSRLPLLRAIDLNVPLHKVPRTSLPGGGDPRVRLDWLPRDEIDRRFASFPEAVAMAAEIAGQCGPALPDGSPVWPDLDLPHGRRPDDALSSLAAAGLERLYGLSAAARVTSRLEKELSAISRFGCAPLFLVVADIAQYARQAGIPVNTRGSVANSLVAFSIGITNVDPIAHDLLFERFLNPARADIPDIDLDFCSRRRDEVLRYVRRRHGRDHVALVSTISTLRPRSAVRETAKAYGLDEAQTKHLVSHLPRGWHPNPRRRTSHSAEDVLAGLQEPRLREVVRAAYGVIGQPHHLSIHPGGVVIAPGPLTDLVPLQWAPKGFLITQYDHRDVEAIGLPKIDLLGVRALTVLAKTEALVQEHHDAGFRLDQIPTDDPKTQSLFSNAETVGVFQCESQGARSTLRKLRACTVRDLAVANAFFKPGPATGGMADHFVRRYRGEEPVTYLHPALAPILDQTMGVLLFQEQILRVAREIAGLTWAQADQLRRGMSHFGRAEMAELQAQFVAGCQVRPPHGPGLGRQEAETLWQQVLAFAGYGFNQGHATAYAGVSYRSAYLKAHWPAAFMAARLSELGGFHHPAIYMAEAVRLGLGVRPPHVNHSGTRFSLDGEWEKGILWMGLGQVRDLRRASVREILRTRKVDAFSSVRDLATRVALQPKEVRHLVQCGALDGLGESRAVMLAEADAIQQAGNSLQMAFAFARPRVAPESPAHRVAWERHLLGQPVSIHPLALVAGGEPALLPLRELPARRDKRASVVGVRLPGWPGGRDFFLGDGDTYVMARGGASLQAPPPWQPVRVQGQWRTDEWGTGWLQVEAMAEMKIE